MGFFRRASIGDRGFQRRRRKFPLRRNLAEAFLSAIREKRGRSFLMKALPRFQYKRGWLHLSSFFDGLAPKAVCAGKLRAVFWYAQKVLEGGRGISFWRVFRGSEGAFPEKKAPSLILSECFEESDLANGLHRGQRVGEGHEDVPRHQTPAVRRRLGLRAVGKREPRSRIRGDGLLRRQFLRFARGEGAAFAGILRRLQFLRQGGIGGRGQRLQLDGETVSCLGGPDPLSCRIPPRSAAGSTVSA